MQSDDATKPDFPRDAKPWLEMLARAETREREYHARADAIDKMYSGPKADVDVTRDRELPVFWANLEVLKPTIYSRPPVPVVSPRFRDRKPLPRAAAEVLERSLIADIEIDHLHDTLTAARDDLARLARGVVWLRLMEDETGPRVTAEHVCRQDFRTGAARKWSEVPWVAKRAFLTREEYRERFKDVGEGVEFKSRSKGDEEDKGIEDQKAAVWEIWHKAKRKVVWVAEGAKMLSDVRDPLYDLDDFWPCPRPAYGTLKPDTLCPVPDVIYYQGQLDEINELTDRIAKLCDALRVKGFYAAGQGDVGTAIELAMADLDNNRIMVPVSNFAALGGAAMKDVIAWLPVEVVAVTLRECVEQRRLLMQDVYEITGLSDIMRGATEAQETLGAQQLKAQFGSVRVKERQGEMQRLARDAMRIKAEIMAEHFPMEVLMDMSQSDLPGQAQIAQQAQAIQQQAMQAMSQVQSPEEAQPIEQQAQQQLAELQGQPTVEAVEQLFRDQRMRPFVLEVETDSTIEPDQMAEKQNRVEFMTALGPMLQQGFAALQVSGNAAPAAGKFFAEALRFVASGFKVERSMDDALDEFADSMANYQPPQEQEADPAVGQAAMMKAQADMAKAQADAEKNQIEAQAKQQEMQLKQQEMQLDGQKTQAEIAKIGAEIEKIRAEIGLKGAEMQLREREVEIGARKTDAEIERGSAEVGLARENAATDREFRSQEIGLNAKKADAEIGLRSRELDEAAPERKAKVGLTEAQAHAARNPLDKAAEAPKRRKMRVTKHSPEGRILEIEQVED